MSTIGGYLDSDGVISVLPWPTILQDPPPDPQVVSPSYLLELLCSYQSGRLYTAKT